MVQTVQPQPEADQPLAELLPAPFKSFKGGSRFKKFKLRFAALRYSEAGSTRLTGSLRSNPLDQRHLR